MCQARGRRGVQHGQDGHRRHSRQLQRPSPRHHRRLRVPLPQDLHGRPARRQDQRPPQRGPGLSLRHRGLVEQVRRRHGRSPPPVRRHPPRQRLRLLAGRGHRQRRLRLRRRHLAGVCPHQGVRGEQGDRALGRRDRVADRGHDVPGRCAGPAERGDVLPGRRVQERAGRYGDVLLRGV